MFIVVFCGVVQYALTLNWAYVVSFYPLHDATRRTDGAFITAEWSFNLFLVIQLSPLRVEIFAYFRRYPFKSTWCVPHFATIKVYSINFLFLSWWFFIYNVSQLSVWVVLLHYNYNLVKVYSICCCFSATRCRVTWLARRCHKYRRGGAGRLCW